MKLLSLATCTLLIVSIGCSQKVAKSPTREGNLHFQPIPLSDPDIAAHGRGAEQWHNQNDVTIPYQDNSTKGTDKYYRFNWTQIETGNGVYDFSIFDDVINDAIDHRQQFSFGIMPVNPTVDESQPDAPKINGKGSAYPLYLHEAMQQETVKDWQSPISGIWTPNWNSEHYLSALERLHAAINKHLLNGSYKGVAYKDVIGYIDVRGFGNFGEWHEAGIVNRMQDHPEGTQATTATLIRIIDAHVKQFPTFQLVNLVSVFDADMLNNTKIPIEVGIHALTVKNEKGLLGWRRDNWGATDDYLERYLSFNDKRLQTSISERWKYAPVVGEPSSENTQSNGCDYGELQNQVIKYHASSFGNGNLSNARKPCIAENVIKAAKSTGYRLLLEGGYIDSTIESGKEFTIRLDWRNDGIAPAYHPWEPWFELRDFITDTLIWSAKSSFPIQHFLPADTNLPFTEKLLLPPHIKTGRYNLNLVIKDPSNYRPPLPLAIFGRKKDGSYSLCTLEVTGIK